MTYDIRNSLFIIHLTFKLDTKTSFISIQLSHLFLKTIINSFLKYLFVIYCNMYDLQNTCSRLYEFCERCLCNYREQKQKDLFATYVLNTK